MQRGGVSIESVWYQWGYRLFLRVSPTKNIKHIYIRKCHLLLPLLLILRQSRNLSSPSYPLLSQTRIFSISVLCKVYSSAARNSGPCFNLLGLWPGLAYSTSTDSSLNSGHSTLDRVDIGQNSIVNLMFF